jgi:hypothetical protein
VQIQYTKFWFLFEPNFLKKNSLGRFKIVKWFCLFSNSLTISWMLFQVKFSVIQAFLFYIAYVGTKFHCLIHPGWCSIAKYTSRVKYCRQSWVFPLPSAKFQNYGKLN